MFRCKMMGINVKRRLYERVAVPTALYGAKTWSMAVAPLNLTPLTFDRNQPVLHLNVPITSTHYSSSIQLSHNISSPLHLIPHSVHVLLHTYFSDTSSPLHFYLFLSATPILHVSLPYSTNGTATPSCKLLLTLIPNCFATKNFLSSSQHLSYIIDPTLYLSKFLHLQ